MNALPACIEEHMDELRALCAKHHVRRLAVFGSAAKGTFDAERSDLDFLVEFQDLVPGEYADAYFGLIFGLEDLFHREIDLVVSSAVRNPYFRQSLEETQRLLYAA